MGSRCTKESSSNVRFYSEGQNSTPYFEMASVEKSAPKWTFMRALDLDDDNETHQDLYGAMKVCYCIL